MRGYVTVLVAVTCAKCGATWQEEKYVLLEKRDETRRERTVNKCSECAVRERARWMK